MGKINQTKIAFIIVFLLLTSSPLTSVKAAALTEWNIPGASPLPYDLTIDDSNNVWFTEHNNEKIGKFTPDGNFMEFKLPDGSHPWDLSMDSLNRIWFTESGRNKIAVLNYPLNEIIEFEVPTSNSEPYGITIDASNKVWFTEHSTNKIGLFTPGINNFIEFERINDGTPCFITTSKDGLEPIWYTVAWNKIGKIERRVGITTSFVTLISTASPSSITTIPSKAINASILSFSSEEKKLEYVETYTTSTSYIKTETSNVLFTSTTLTLTSTIIQAVSTLTTETSTLYATKTIYVDTTTEVLTETITTTVYSTTLLIETTVATPIPAYSSKEILIGVLIGVLTILALKSKIKNSSRKI